MNFVVKYNLRGVSMNKNDATVPISSPSCEDKSARVEESDYLDVEKFWRDYPLVSTPQTNINT